jgi:hypothetical protein
MGWRIHRGKSTHPLDAPPGAADMRHRRSKGRRSMTDNLQHILAASCLVTHCEQLARSGRLTGADELDLRAAIARTRIAFSFGLPGERSNDNLSSPDAALDLIRPVMAEEATNV